ncbi:hypothetical protein ACOJB1_12755 [Enterococcus innesii]|uniref:hypothetical protein n=1 Tax=Enterococcus TaxID=1350 RepID=UPI003B5A5F0D
MKCRKKPIEVEAILLENDYHSFFKVLEFVAGMPVAEENALLNEIAFSASQDLGGIALPTLEGTMLASFGDYIIKGVEGEFYPCKPDIFAKTYEIIQEETV